nr:hypothetical protein [uncultured Sphingomonas sp.]
MPWQPQERGRDRTKALVLVVALHLGLGAALVLGLAGEPLKRSVEALTTFDVPLPSVPPPEPAPRDQDSAEERDEGATDLEARPAAVVRTPPEVRLPVPPVLRTADEAAPEPGTSPSAGSGSMAGQGQGSGLAGSGAGGGGNGGQGRGGLGSEARLLSGNLSRGDYRRIRGFGAPRGSAVLALDIGADGRVTRCLPVATSGNAALDGELCRLLGRTRWEPARDRGDTPVPVALRYVATWDRN